MPNASLGLQMLQAQDAGFSRGAKALQIREQAEDRKTRMEAGTKAAMGDMEGASQTAFKSGRLDLGSEFLEMAKRQKDQKTLSDAWGRFQQDNKLTYEERSELAFILGGQGNYEGASAMFKSVAEAMDNEKRRGAQAVFDAYMANPEKNRAKFLRNFIGQMDKADIPEKYLEMLKDNNPDNDRDALIMWATEYGADTSALTKERELAAKTAASRSAKGPGSNVLSAGAVLVDDNGNELYRNPANPNVQIVDGGGGRQVAYDKNTGQSSEVVSAQDASRNDAQRQTMLASEKARLEVEQQLPTLEAQSQGLVNDLLALDGHDKFDALFGFDARVPKIDGSPERDAWALLQKIKSKSWLEGIKGVTGLAPITEPENQRIESAQSVLNTTGISSTMARAAIQDIITTLNDRMTRTRDQASGTAPGYQGATVPDAELEGMSKADLDALEARLDAQMGAQ